MGWLIAAGVILALALLPLGLRVLYDGDGLRVHLRIGPGRIALYPAKPKGKKQNPTPKKSGSKKTAEKAPEEKKGGKWTDFLPLVDRAVKFLDHFRKKLCVKRLELKLTLAGDDPCDLAVNYGRAWAAVGTLIPQLERVLKIKKRDVGVACDFTAEQTTVYCLADIRISVSVLLYLLACHGVGVAKQIYNLKKGGAEK